MPRRARSLPAPGWPVVVAGALVLGLLAPGCAAAAHSARPHSSQRFACPPAKSRQVAKGRVVRVYSTTAPAGRARVSACVRGGGAPMTLISPPARGGGFDSLGAVAVAGTLVAYVETRAGVDSGTSTIHVADVAAHRFLRSLPGGSYVDAGIVKRERVTALAVVAPDGGVAWIVEAGARHRPKVLRVYSAARSGPVTLLDEGPDIGAESLRVSGRTVSWSRGGQTRSSQLAQ